VVLVRSENIMQTVLVFEPDKTLRTLYKEELEDEGYHVCLSKYEKEALALLKITPVNILVTEHQLEPTETYTDLLALAREVKHIPVIILPVTHGTSLTLNGGGKWSMSVKHPIWMFSRKP
jgi:DNA-binding NtrC family response regulator